MLNVKREITSEQKMQPRELKREFDINIFCNLQGYIFRWRSLVSIDTAEDRHRPGPADAYKRRLRAHDNVGHLHATSRRKQNS